MPETEALRSEAEAETEAFRPETEARRWVRLETEAPRPEATSLGIPFHTVTLRALIL